MAYQLVLNVVRQYAPWVMLPITMTVGYIGYKMEGWFRKPNSLEPPRSTEEVRHERLLKELEYTYNNSSNNSDKNNNKT